MKNLDFATIRESVKNAYANGTGTFKDVAAAAGLEYIPSGKSQLTKRATPTIEANGRAYDFHAFLKACNIEIVKHERLTAGGERIPSHRSRVEKLGAAIKTFEDRVFEITGVKLLETWVMDENILIASRAASDLDKKEEKERAAAIEKAKEERANKRAAAAIEKKSDEEKLRIAAAALGVSVEQIKAMQAQIKPAKVK